MVKKKSRSKKVKTKSRSSRLRQSVERRGMNWYAWLFVNALVIVIFVYGLWRIWRYSWTEGLSIIVAELIVILIIKVIMKLRRR